MQLSGNTILITGGASGIGYAFAERFLAAGSEVIICGRREDKLREAKEKHPQLHTRVCDVADEQERIALFDWATSEFPRLNVLVNNAGIQRHLNLTESEDWQRTRSEIAINFDAPVHLSRLFLPHLLDGREKPAILNVTSGLSFVPLANVPVYCATKAALHSFTLSLRYQLRETPVEVIEIIPPAVDTDLGGVGLHTFGVNLDEFADFVFEGLKGNQIEIAYGTAATASRASREEIDEIFKHLNQTFAA
ncbi:MAG: SDR family NAD(P)-dependent oxidoreductase [Acidobacteriota bacterium]|nr:SDR family NAD(P)-dependent oxidoreductase [Acidobacteriota bacterium]